jgi:DNA-binding response OmpR family regulator
MFFNYYVVSRNDLSKLKAIIVDENRDVNCLLAGIFTLKGFETYKAFSVSECLNILKELEGKVDIIFMDGKIAADRGALLIIKVKRINPDIKVIAVANDESDKTRVLDYGADDFTTKPISLETIIDRANSMLLGKDRKNT